MAAPRRGQAGGFGVGPLVYGPVPNQAPYAYRSYTGIIPTTEWSVFFDDFYRAPASNIPFGWGNSLLQTTGTISQNNTAALGNNGVITMTHATASQGVVAYHSGKPIQLQTGKRFFIEARVRTDDVTDNTIQIGLSDLTATTNATDIFTTTAANVMSAGITDQATPAATTTMFVDKANSNPSTLVTSGNSAVAIRSMIANNWHVLALSYDGTSVTCWLDGKLSQIWNGGAATIPTGVALSPFFGFSNGDGAGGANVHWDYVRWALER